MEIWRAIKGYEGLYEVSNLGRVKSFDNYGKGKLNSLRLRKGKILKPMVTHNNYLRVGLYLNIKLNWFAIHRLVAQAFIPNPENKPNVIHIDGNKQNNHVSNLEYTYTLRKLTYQDVSKIRVLIKEGLSLREIGKVFDVDYTTIYHIKTGKTWNR